MRQGTINMCSAAVLQRSATQGVPTQYLVNRWRWGLPPPCHVVPCRSGTQWALAGWEGRTRKSIEDQSAPSTDALQPSNSISYVRQKHTWEESEKLADAPPPR